MEARDNYVLQVILLAKKYWGCLLVRCLASVGLVIFDIFVPLIISVLLDQIIYFNNKAFLFMCIPTIIILIFGHIFMMFFGVATWGYLESHFIVELREKTLKDILYMRAEKFNSYTVSQLLQILNDDLGQFMQVLIRNISNAVIYTIYCVLILYALFRVNYQVACICIIMIVINIAAGKQFGRKGRLEKSKYREEMGKYKEWVIDHVRGMYEIENLCIKENASDKYLDRLKEYTYRIFRTNIADNIYPNVNEALSDIARLLIYTVGAYLVVQSRLSVGEIIACISYYGLLYVHLSKLLNIAFDYSVRKIHIQKVFSLWNHKPEILDTGDRLDSINDLELYKVQFSYCPEKTVLYDLNLSLKKGEVVNIIGSNGKGKSTITYLLYRLYREQEGQIFINGKNIDCYRVSDIRNNIGIVSQKSGFLTGKFIDVLTTGCQEQKCENEIIELLEKMKLINRVRQLPNGINTFVHNFDREFSVGEIQRITLANILLRNCEIVIFDEITAHLDDDMENLIYNLLESILNNKIVINITHKKLFTGKNAKIYYL